MRTGLFDRHPREKSEGKSESTHRQLAWIFFMKRVNDTEPLPPMLLVHSVSASSYAGQSSYQLTKHIYNTRLTVPDQNLPTVFDTTPLVSLPPHHETRIPCPPFFSSKLYSTSISPKVLVRIWARVP